MKKFLVLISILSMSSAVSAIQCPEYNSLKNLKAGDHFGIWTVNMNYWSKDAVFSLSGYDDSYSGFLTCFYKTPGASDQMPSTALSTYGTFTPVYSKYWAKDKDLPDYKRCRQGTSACSVEMKK